MGYDGGDFSNGVVATPLSSVITPANPQEDTGRSVEDSLRSIVNNPEAPADQRALAEAHLRGMKVSRILPPYANQ